MDLMNRIRSCKSWLTTVILLLIILRLSVLALSPDGSILYLVRQVICTVAWGGVAFFMMNCSMDFYHTIDKQRIRYMKKVAFWAMIACLARVTSTAVYYWPVVSGNIVMSAHNIVELATWILLAVFFGCYWRLRDQQEDDLY